MILSSPRTPRAAISLATQLVPAHRGDRGVRPTARLAFDLTALPARFLSPPPSAGRRVPRQRRGGALLTLLGKIVEANDSSTSQQYTIDDGTGTVVVKKWVDADDAEGAADLAVGQYVRVYGHLRVFQGARNVIAFNMRPVTDFNEITYHFLEVVYCNSHNGARAAAAPKAEAGAAEGTAYAASAAAAAAGTTAAGSCSDQVMAIYNGPRVPRQRRARGDVVPRQRTPPRRRCARRWNTSSTRDTCTPPSTTTTAPRPGECPGRAGRGLGSVGARGQGGHSEKKICPSSFDPRDATRRSFPSRRRPSTTARHSAFPDASVGGRGVAPDAPSRLFGGSKSPPAPNAPKSHDPSPGSNPVSPTPVPAPSSSSSSPAKRPRSASTSSRQSPTTRARAGRTGSRGSPAAWLSLGRFPPPPPPPPPPPLPPPTLPPRARARRSVFVILERQVAHPPSDGVQIAADSPIPADWTFDRDPSPGPSRRRRPRRRRRRRRPGSSTPRTAARAPPPRRSPRRRRTDARESAADGLSSGSRRRHDETRSRASSEIHSGIVGSSPVPPILNMACTCPPQSLHGGAPVSISITTHPTDHTSAGAPCVCCLTTSGAIQNALPAMASPPRPAPPSPSAPRSVSPCRNPPV